MVKVLISYEQANKIRKMEFNLELYAYVEQNCNFVCLCPRNRNK